MFEQNVITVQSWILKLDLKGEHSIPPTFQKVKVCISGGQQEEAGVLVKLRLWLAAWSLCLDIQSVKFGFNVWIRGARCHSASTQQGASYPIAWSKPGSNRFNDQNLVLRWEKVSEHSFFYEVQWKDKTENMSCGGNWPTPSGKNP